MVRKGKTRAGSIVIPIHTLSVGSFLSLSLSPRAIASRAPDTTHAAHTRPFPFVADEDHKEWYQLNTPKGTGAFLQLGLRYTFLKGKDEGLIVPPLPFAPERFVKKDPTRSPSLSRMTQAKAKGHRAIHRCCDRENVFLVAKDHDEWTALPEHSEEKTGRAFIRGVFGYGNISAFDLTRPSICSSSSARRMAPGPTWEPPPPTRAHEARDQQRGGPNPEDLRPVPHLRRRRR